MSVRIVRSTEAGCEPNCPEWIVADGEITTSTATQFRKAFKLAGKDNLPIVLNSPGGRVDVAIEIGRLIRQRKAETMVAKTVFQGCSPVTDAKCDASSPHSQRYPAYPDVVHGMCASACVFLFAAGTKRMADENSIGTHQVVNYQSMRQVWYRETYRLIHGKKHVISRKITKQKTITLKPTTKLPRAMRGRFSRYFAEMGVKESFLPLFEMAAPESIHILDRSEMYSTGIVTDALPGQPAFRKARCAGVGINGACVALP